MCFVCNTMDCVFLFVDKKKPSNQRITKRGWGRGGEISGKQNFEVEPSSQLFLGTSRLVFRTLAGCSDGGVGRTRRLAGLRGECTQMHCTALRCIPRLYLYLYLPPPSPSSPFFSAPLHVWTLDPGFSWVANSCIWTIESCHQLPNAQTCIQSILNIIQANVLMVISLIIICWNE